MMGTWKRAAEQAWDHSRSERVYIYNSIYNKYGAGTPGSGVISLYLDEYRVENLYTQERKEGLEDSQVEEYVKKLNIDNTGWVFYM